MATVNPANAEYTERIDRVIDYLRENLHRPVKLEELAKVACFSPFHFHRVFTAVTGETLNDLTTRLRLAKAARLLKYTAENLTDIALDCGFSSPATFSRAFRASFGESPSQYRKTGKHQNSKIRKEVFDGRDYYLPMSFAEKKAAFPVTLRRLPERRGVYLRVVNAFEGDRVRLAYANVTEWAKREGIYEHGTLFGMSSDDPHLTPRKLHRHEVCFATDRPFRLAKGMARLKMPAMLYAVIRVSGDIRMVATAIDYLFRGWLIQSDYEPVQAPGLEIFLDKDKATDWSHFELDLCVPVKKMRKKR